MKTRLKAPLFLRITSVFEISASNLTENTNFRKFPPRVTIPPFSAWTDKSNAKKYYGRERVFEVHSISDTASFSSY